MFSKHAFGFAFGGGEIKFLLDFKGANYPARELDGGLSRAELSNGSATLTDHVSAVNEPHGYRAAMLLKCYDLGFQIRYLRFEK